MSRKLIQYCGVFLMALLLVTDAHLARAQDNGSLSVTVTPPLYQLTIGPGETWTTTLKVINSNPYDVTYYAQVAQMQPQGEEGRSKFVPVLETPSASTSASYILAHWIKISREPIFVKAGSSADVPFTVDIPQNAEPGGHYAAILVGTEPDALNATGTMLKVSSLVSSLLFVRIKGEVIESGRIREFLTSRALYQAPDVDFSLRFENTGNTHVQPQGDIAIYNMWGKERGRVSINQGSDFGNVLPHTVRRFEFSWQGEQDLFDIGLYSAVVTLAYGQEGKKNITSKALFWVVPVVPVSIGVGSVLLFILIFVWLVRRYIRRALLLEQKRLGMYTTLEVSAPVTSKTLVRTPAQPPTQSVQTVSLRRSLMQPIQEGVIDLRSIASKQPVEQLPYLSEQTHTPTQFFRKYKLLWVFLVLVVFGTASAWLYFSKVLVKSRGFQITDVQIREETAPTQGTNQ